MTKGNVSIRQAAVELHKELQGRIDKTMIHIKNLRENPESADWIIDYSSLELELLIRNLQTLEEWMINDNYDY